MRVLGRFLHIDWQETTKLLRKICMRKSEKALQATLRTIKVIFVAMGNSVSVFEARLTTNNGRPSCEILDPSKQVHLLIEDKLKCTWSSGAAEGSFPWKSRGKGFVDARTFASAYTFTLINRKQQRGVVRTQEEGQMCEGNSRYATLPINTIPAQVIHLNCVRKNQMAVSLLQQRESWPTSGLACGCLNQVMVKLKVHSGK